MAPPGVLDDVFPKTLHVGPQLVAIQLGNFPAGSSIDRRVGKGNPQFGVFTGRERNAPFNHALGRIPHSRWRRHFCVPMDSALFRLGNDVAHILLKRFRRVH